MMAIVHSNFQSASAIVSICSHRRFGLRNSRNSYFFFSRTVDVSQKIAQKYEIAQQIALKTEIFKSFQKF